MVHSNLNLSEAVSTRIFRFDLANRPPDPALEVLSGAVLVLDGFDWSLDPAALRAFQSEERRMFGDPFTSREAGDPDLRSFLDDLRGVFRTLFGHRYPEPIEERKSFRNMRTGPEPLHFDTFYRTGVIPITSYFNFSSTPREYGVGRDLYSLARSGELREAGEQVFEPALSVVRLRRLGKNGQGPLGPTAPRHYLSLVSGSVMILDPKIVSHEILSGDGALCYSWLVGEPAYRLEELAV